MSAVSGSIALGRAVPGLVPRRHPRPGTPARRAARRIALVSDWFLPRRGGIELQLAGLAAHLAAGGHHVDVITPTPGDPESGVVRLDVPRLPGAGVAYTPALGHALAQALDVGAYDVVHAHASVVSPAAFAAVRAARRRGIPCLVTFHSVLDAAAPLLGAVDALTGWARDPGVVLSGVSTLVADQLRRGVPMARVRVLPNGADLAWWRARPRNGAGGRPAEVRFVTAMRLVRKKRPLALVPVAAAMRAAAPAGVRVRMLVAGEGAERARLERAARRAGLADVVSVLGWQSRAGLRALYRTADTFVLPTVRESFGIAALEARAAGLAVLARAGSGVADFVAPGVDGWLCASDAELAERAAAWVHDPAALARTRAASAADVPVAFGWDAVTDAHLDAYVAAAAVR
ncbi:glycosyl transferase [Gemmatimonadetes bacterium T265]|nr:glycosyl transferase [Gemmatimonadetes bacterium T265]